jgi:hypothetical protein
VPVALLQLRRRAGAANAELSVTKRCRIWHKLEATARGQTRKDPAGANHGKMSVVFNVISQDGARVRMRRARREEQRLFLASSYREPALRVGALLGLYGVLP